MLSLLRISGEKWQDLSMEGSAGGRPWLPIGRLRQFVLPECHTPMVTFVATTFCSLPCLIVAPLAQVKYMAHSGSPVSSQTWGCCCPHTSLSLCHSQKLWRYQSKNMPLSPKFNCFLPLPIWYMRSLQSKYPSSNRRPESLISGMPS